MLVVELLLGLAMLSLTMVSATLIAPGFWEDRHRLALGTGWAAAAALALIVALFA